MNIRLLILLMIFPILVSMQDNRNDFEVLAENYFNQGKLSQAGDFYNKAGYAYWNKGNSEKAADAFKKAYDIFNNQGNVIACITVSNNLGLVSLDINKYQNAHTAFSNALQYARKTKNQVEIYNALVNIANVDLELASYSDAVEKATEAMNIATELNNIKQLAKCYSLLAESYEKMGNSSSAYKYYEMYATIDQKIKQLEMEDLKNMSAEEISKANELKRFSEIELKVKKGELKLTQDSLAVSERVSLERQMQIEKRNLLLHQKEMQLRYERKLSRTLFWGIIIVVTFLGLLGFLLFQKLRDNKLLKKQKEEITKQRNKLDTQNQKITDSIHYGLRIQQAMLPNLSSLEEVFETFIIYWPKDIVSGDFYWYYETKFNNLFYKFIAVADCTGHGVPGAFMSMIGNRLLNEIIADRKIYQPSDILQRLNTSLRKELHQDIKRNMDGMDISICRLAAIDSESYELVFSGAKRPLLVYSKNKEMIETIDGDHKTIGGVFSGTTKSFTEKHLKICSGDSIYMLSDGFIDQQNSNRSRLGSNRLISTLTENQDKPMQELKQLLENLYNKFKEDEEQRDDITLLGIRIK